MIARRPSSHISHQPVYFAGHDLPPAASREDYFADDRIAAVAEQADVYGDFIGTAIVFQTPTLPRLRRLRCGERPKRFGACGRAVSFLRSFARTRGGSGVGVKSRADTVPAEGEFGRILDATFPAAMAWFQAARRSRRIS